jgi:uncharacterized membrane protein YsdA (DUF1294 family)
MDILTIVFLMMNIFAFFIMSYDKRLAKMKRTRISENNLLTISILGGSLGILSAMILFRHKTSKGSFVLKFIFTILIQLIVLFWIVSSINNN